MSQSDGADHSAQIGTLKRMKTLLRESHRRLILGRAIRSLQRDIRAGIVQNDLISQLRYGWGNEGWSGSENYIRGCLNEALRCEGPILECGTGLTTLIIGAVAESRSLPFVSLEHSAEWRDHTSAVAKSLGLANVHIHHAPLVDCGSYEWYDVSRMCDRGFSLILCDGPPAQTKGGRYGLLPAARHLMADPCTILLDDAVREDERRVAQKWRQEAPLESVMIGAENPYFRLVLRGSLRSAARAPRIRGHRR